MNKVYQLVIISLLLPFLATTAVAADIIVSPHHTTPGTNITLHYTALPDGTQINLYQNAALLPLLASPIVTESGNGSFSIGDILEPGTYQIRCEQDSTTLASETLTVTDYPLLKKQWSICLMTDIHVMHPDLVRKAGNAYNNLLASDRKMLAQSADAFKSLADSVILHHPDLCLIAGDLTKDGEKISHQLVAAQLKRIHEAGIQCLVVPGNHDIKNPNALYYDGDKTLPAEDILEEEFRNIYHDYGYGDHSEQDRRSLSYITEPLPDICIIGIDATRYYDNQSVQHGDAANKTFGDGLLRDETLQWILAKADEAQAAGKTIIAMMHHQLLQHFNMQDRLVSSAAIAQGNSISRLFMEHGIHLILTGHMHTSNISKYYNETLTDSIIEITTGSTIAYPSHYRWLTVNANRNRIEVNTRNLKTLNSIPDFGKYGQQELIRHMPQITKSLTYTLLNLIEQVRNNPDNSDSRLLNNLFSWLPEDRTQTAEMVYQYLGGPLTLAMLTNNEGNEHLKQTDSIITMTQTGLEQMLDKMMEETYGPIERKLRIKMIMGLVKAPMNLLFTSILDDITYYGTRFADQTNDLYTVLNLPAYIPIETGTTSPVGTEQNGNWYDILGRRLTAPPTRSGLYIHGGKKVYIP